MRVQIAARDELRLRNGDVAMQSLFEHVAFVRPIDRERREVVRGGGSEFVEVKNMATTEDAAPGIVGQCRTCKQPITFDGKTLKCACRTQPVSNGDICDWCNHLHYSKYDPSPHGVGLGAGYMYVVECDVDDAAEKCPGEPPYGSFEWREDEPDWPGDEEYEGDDGQ